MAHFICCCNRMNHFCPLVICASIWCSWYSRKKPIWFNCNLNFWRFKEEKYADTIFPEFKRNKYFRIKKLEWNMHLFDGIGVFWTIQICNEYSAAIFASSNAFYEKVTLDQTQSNSKENAVNCRKTAVPHGNFLT